MDDRYIKLVEEIRTTLVDSTTEASLSRFVALARQYDIPLSTVRLMLKGELNRKKYQEIWGNLIEPKPVITDSPKVFVKPSIEKEGVPVPIQKQPIVKLPKKQSNKNRTPLLIILGILLLAILGFLAFDNDLFQNEQQIEPITNISDLKGQYEGEFLREDKKITLFIHTITPDRLNSYFDFEGTINVSRTYSDAPISGRISKDLQKISFNFFKRKTVTYKVLSEGDIFMNNRRIQIIAEDESWEVKQVN